jgi:hypothetical protein
LGGYNGYLDGKLGDFRIWNIARTQEEIQSDYWKQLTGSESGLVLYWKMDEGTGTNCNDSTSGNHDGTIVGGGSWDDNGCWANLASGKLAIQGEINWSNGTMKPKIYDQNDEPDIGNDEMVIWKDADGGPKYYLIVDFNGVQKKAELV